jgi:SCO1/SenC
LPPIETTSTIIRRKVSLARRYYSVRTGSNPLAGGFDLDTMRSLFREIFIYFEDEGYFQESLGYDCVDADGGFIAGKLGRSIEGALLLALRKQNLAPIRQRIAFYEEEDLFDVIEFLFDHCSKPVDRHYHSYNNCGWHCHTFDRDPGRAEFREKIGELLGAYDSGYELSAAGEVLALGDPGLAPLHDAPLPTPDADNVASRVAAAQAKFRRHSSTVSDRRDAVRDLADVLEYLRPQLDGVLTNKDDAALFTIANNFAIRHHNAKQQGTYDKAIWHSWMFYFYLATIHAAVRLIEKKKSK